MSQEPQTPVKVSARSALVLAVPLLLVNTMGSAGQAGWAWSHLIPADLKSDALPAAIVAAVLFAVTIESVGVYLAYEAHVTRMADQSAGALALGSYAVGALAGTLNYWHFAPDWRPNAVAVTFAALSSISPWLWSVRSRSMNRERLSALGLIDRRAVKLGKARWLLHPALSLRVLSWATWAGVNNIDEAVDGWQTARTRRGKSPGPARGVAQVPSPPAEVPVRATAEVAPVAPAGPVPALEVAPAPRALRPGVIRQPAVPDWYRVSRGDRPSLGIRCKVSLPDEEPVPALEVAPAPPWEPFVVPSPEPEPARTVAATNGHGARKPTTERIVSRTRAGGADATTLAREHAGIVREIIDGPGKTRDLVKERLGVGTSTAEEVIKLVKQMST